LGGWLVDYNKLLRFIHVPKTGGRALIQYLNSCGVNFLHGIEKSPGVFVRKHGTATTWAEEASYKFAVVRDPYTRLVSYYCYVLERKALDCTFERFVLDQVEPSELGRITSPWLPQCFWLFNNGDLAVDLVPQFENLNHEINQHFGLTNQMQKVNVTNTNNDNLMSWYTPELKHAVYAHFVQDFEFIEKLK
jgi:hypothetical protein